MSRPPAEMFDRVVEWFLTGSPVIGATEPPMSGNSPAAAILAGDSLARYRDLASEALLAEQGFVERGVLISAESELVGVWCLPEEMDSSSPVVIFCNAGRNPHIGWARGSVTLARRLARQGIASLRFDLPGLGDSLPLPDPPQNYFTTASRRLICARGSTLSRRNGATTIPSV